MINMTTNKMNKNKFKVKKNMCMYLENCYVKSFDQNTKQFSFLANDPIFDLTASNN